MLNDVLVITGNPKTWKEALSLTYTELHNHGYVRESFLSACIEREKRLPTGLPTAIGVAIPHTDAEHVLIPAICMLKLENPVSFGNMGDPDCSVNVCYVFNLALKESKDQLPMLRSIIHLVKDRKYLEDCRNKSLKEIQEELISLWCNENSIANLKGNR